MTLTATTATATVELAVPTNLGDLTVVQPAKTAWTDDQWASYINAPEANPVLAIIERGKRIAEYKAIVHAKKQTGFEIFCRERLKVSKEYAYRLIAIASCRFENLGRCSNILGEGGRYTLIDSALEGAYHKNRERLCTIFPASVSTLYSLACFAKEDGEEAFEEAIQSGAVRPEMTRAEAEALRGKQRKVTTPAIPAQSNPVPSVSAPASTTRDEIEVEVEVEIEGDDLPFDPSPDGKATFVPSNSATAPNTSTPSPSPGNTPDVEDNEEEEDDLARTRTRLYAKDVVTDPEQKMRLELTHMLGQISGGNNFDGTTVRLFIPSYMKELNAAAVYNTMRSTMMQSLSNGTGLEDARDNAKEEMEAFRAEMHRLVDEACNAGEQMFVQRTAPMDMATKFLPKAFHLTTPLNEAVTAATMALKVMGHMKDGE